MVAGLAGILVGLVLIVRWVAMRDVGEWELQLTALAAFPTLVVVLLWVIHSVRSSSRLGSAPGLKAIFARLLLYSVLWAMAVAAVMSVKRSEEQRTDYRLCMNKLERLSNAMGMYLRDWDGCFPPAATWCDDLVPYLPDHVDAYALFVCPSVPDLKSGYAFNASLSEQRRGAVSKPKDTIVLFESDRGWNAYGGPEMLPGQPRHSWRDAYGWQRGENYATALLDTQWVRMLPRKKLPDGSWAKEPDADWVRWKP